MWSPMNNASGVLRGIGIGAGIALVAGFIFGFTTDLFIPILIPVVLAALCSFADQCFSFLGYSVGFGMLALIFSLILNAVSPGLEIYLGVYAVIFAFTLLPVLFFGSVMRSKKNLPKQTPTSNEEGARVPPIYVPEGVEVRLKTSSGKEAGKPKTRLEELDQQSSLTYLCPYCNAQVQATDAKCPACGAELDRRVTKIN